MFKQIILSGDFFKLTNYIMTLVIISSFSSHDENAFDLTSMMLIVCNSSQHFKHPKSLLTLKTISWLTHLVKSENKLYRSNIQWHRIPFPIPIERNVYIVREDWTKAENQAENNKSCSSVSDTWGFIIKGLRRRPYP